MAISLFATHSTSSLSTLLANWAAATLGSSVLSPKCMEHSAQTLHLAFPQSEMLFPRCGMVHFLLPPLISFSLCSSVFLSESTKQMGTSPRFSLFSYPSFPSQCLSLPYIMYLFVSPQQNVNSVRKGILSVYSLLLSLAPRTVLDRQQLLHNIC